MEKAFYQIIPFSHILYGNRCISHADKLKVLPSYISKQLCPLLLVTSLTFGALIFSLIHIVSLYFRLRP